MPQGDTPLRLIHYGVPLFLHAERREMLHVETEIHILVPILMPKFACIGTSGTFVTHKPVHVARGPVVLRYLDTLSSTTAA